MLKLHELSIKYANIGLYIDITFERMGLTLRGYWDRICGDICEYDNYNRLFSWEFIEQTKADIETIVDSFKEEFAQSLRGKDK